MKQPVFLSSSDLPPVCVLPADLFSSVNNLDELVLGRPLVNALDITDGIKRVLAPNSYGCGTNQLRLIHVGREELAMQSIRNPDVHREIRVADKNRHGDPLKVKITEVETVLLEPDGQIVRQGIICSVSDPDIRGVPYSLTFEQRNLRRCVGLQPDEGQPPILFLGIARALTVRAQPDNLPGLLSDIIGATVHLGDVSFIPRRVGRA